MEMLRSAPEPSAGTWNGTWAATKFSLRRTVSRSLSCPAVAAPRYLSLLLSVAARSMRAYSFNIENGS